MGKKLWGAVVAISILVGIVAGIVTIYQLFQNRIDRFEGDIGEQAKADGLVDFVQSHDAKVVWFNVVCHEDLPGHPCETGVAGSELDQQSRAEGKLVIAVHATSGDYWFHVKTDNSNAEADNGPYGAGSIVIKGYFTVSVRGRTGITPPNIQNFNLDGVDSSTIKSS